MLSEWLKRIEPLIFVGAFFGLIGGTVAMIVGSGWTQAAGLAFFILGILFFTWAADHFDGPET